MEPITRKEMYYAYMNGDTSVKLPAPVTREEKYLYALCMKGGSGGGTGGIDNITVNGVMQPVSGGTVDITVPTADDVDGFVDQKLSNMGLANVAEQLEQLSSLPDSVRTLDSSVTSLDNMVTDLNNTMSALDDRVISLESAESFLRGTVSDLWSAVIALNDGLSDLPDRMNTMEGTVGAIESDMGQLQQTFEQASAEITQQIEQLWQAISSLQ